MRDRHPKERQAAKLARKNASRNSHDRILIICEGKKTEPQYFNEIRQYYRLNTAYVGILQSEYGTSPQQVVDFARDKCLTLLAACPLFVLLLVPLRVFLL